MALTKVNNDLQDALAAAQPTITSTGTLTNFTSTGIDDNATSNAITITSDEKVGIGIDSARESLGVADSIVTGDLADSTTTVYRLEPDNSAFIRQLTISDRGGATAGAGKGNAIIFSSKYTGDVQQGMAGIVGISESISGTQKGALAFLTRAHDENPDEKMRITADGNVKISSSGVTPEGRLDIDSGSYSANPAIMLGGNIDTTGAGGRGDNARKYASIVGKHFSNEEQPVGILAYDCQSDALAIINYGIPSSNYNSPTEHRFFTTANATTVGGGVNLRMAIDGYGRVTTPHQPSFDVFSDGNAGQIAAGVYTWTNENFDTGNNFSSNKFTAPVAGKYYFTVTQQLYGMTSTGIGILFRKNGSNYGPYSYSNNPTSTYHNSVTVNRIISLAANDYVDVYRAETTRGMQSTFSGFLIG